MYYLRSIKKTHQLYCYQRSNCSYTKTQECSYQNILGEFSTFDSFKSPNLKTDFAANRKPIPCQLPVIINTKTNKRSNMPMYLPALGSDSLLSSFSDLDQFVINTCTITPLTAVINSRAVANIQIVGCSASSRKSMSGLTQNIHTAMMLTRCSA